MYMYLYASVCVHSATQKYVGNLKFPKNGFA